MILGLHDNIYSCILGVSTLNSRNLIDGEQVLNSNKGYILHGKIIYLVGTYLPNYCFSVVIN